MKKSNDWSVYAPSSECELRYEHLLFPQSASVVFLRALHVISVSKNTRYTLHTSINELRKDTQETDGVGGCL